MMTIITTTTVADSATDRSVSSDGRASAYGMRTEAKNVYKSKEDANGDYTWTDKYPEDVEEAAEDEETRECAIIVRNVKSKDSRKALEAQSIVIQSPPLREALGHILHDYPGVACELRRLEFVAPFEPFVHRWTEFRAYMRRDDLDPTTKEHLDLLHDILKTEIGDSLAAYEDYMATGKITFKHLWMVFQLGTVILSTSGGPLAAFELQETKFKKSPNCGLVFSLKAEYVDHDGKRFGRCHTFINICEFLGTVNVTSLEAFPLAFHEDQDTVRATLISRGQLFEKLAGHHYKTYDGTAITWDKDDKEMPIYVNGRIVIDMDSFNRLSPYPCHSVKGWAEKDKPLLAGQAEEKGGNGEEARTVLTPYHHMLCRSRTSGYSLKLKKWLDFYVDNVGEITWNTDAFDRLVLPEDQKELILAFSESQMEETAFDDVISGKGKGVICLLSGPPGVGKTLTAEAVAEYMKVPLHTLTAGDLGYGPFDMEEALNDLMGLVTRWKAIVLLDECDVFLEKRSTADLQRNSVVSVFLRMLEYYQGILFMTTNRVNQIDQAFRSRIHVSLEYPDLDQASRRKIWASFLSGASFEYEMSETDLDHLSSIKMNGREIKTTLKTAQLLATRKKAPLKREFVDIVLSMEKR
ncbi:ATPase [Poronia punctata]|nr:ATPase [Poronia punctata]